MRPAYLMTLLLALGPALPAGTLTIRNDSTYDWYLRPAVSTSSLPAHTLAPGASLTRTLAAGEAEDYLLTDDTGVAGAILHLVQAPDAQGRAAVPRFAVTADPDWASRQDEVLRQAGDILVIQSSTWQDPIDRDSSDDESDSPAAEAADDPGAAAEPPRVAGLLRDPATGRTWVQVFHVVPGADGSPTLEPAEDDAMADEPPSLPPPPAKAS